MEVKDKFLSKTNLNFLCKKLGEKLDLESGDQMDACAELLKEQMKSTYKQNEQNLNKAPAEKVVKILNKKTFDSCEQLYNNRVTNSKRSRSIGQYSMERDREINGNRQNRIPKRAAATATSRRRERSSGSSGSSGSGLRGMDENMGGFGGFASVPSSEGEFIAADGSMGKSFVTDRNYNDDLQMNNKRAIKGDLMREALVRKSTYEGGTGLGEVDPNTGMPMVTHDQQYGNNNYGNNNYGNNNYRNDNHGNNNYNNGMSYDPNPYGNKQPQQEINFALDGGDSRTKTRDGFGNDISSNDGGYGGYGDNSYGGYNGMDSMGGMGGMGGMDQSGFQGNGGFQGNNGYNENMMRLMQEQQGGMGGSNGMNGMNDINHMGSMNNMLQNMQQPQQSYNNQQQPQQQQQLDPNMMQMMMQMMQMMNQGGGDQQGDNSLELDELKRKNNEMSASLAYGLKMSPQELIDKDPEEIGHIVDMIKSGKTPKRRNYDTSSDESSDDEQLTKGMSVKDKLQLLLKMKKQNKTKGKKLHKYVENSVDHIKKNKYDCSSDSENSSDEEIVHKHKHKTKKSAKKPTKKLTKKILHESSDESSDESPVKPAPSKLKSSKKLTKIVEPTESDNSDNSDNSETEHNAKTINKQTIKVSSEDYINPSSYMHDFKTDDDDGLFNVTEINIKNINVPFSPSITDESNSLIINGDDYALEVGSYDFDEILDSFNESFADNDNPITIYEKGHNVVIESTDGSTFEVDCTENSMANILGFTKETYSGKSKYVAETRHAFISTPVYMYIKNINNEKPFAVIYPDGKIKQKISKFDDPIGELSCLIIQFRNDQTSDKTDLVNFGNSSNDMTLVIHQISD
jgi:hypothetical protein